MCIPIKPDRLESLVFKAMAEQPQVVHEGPHAGLYVPLNGQFAYVKGETRPYAPPFNTVIYDSVKHVVFYTQSPHIIDANPAYSVAPQSAQDEYAYFYRGNMPYCNGAVHEVKNRLMTKYTIITRVQLHNRRRPMTPQTTQRLQRSITPDDDWLEKLSVDELLQEFDGH